MEIKLKRNIKTKNYLIKAEIQTLEDREEIVAILKLAHENNDKVTPKLICEKLLANRPIKVGERVIEWCNDLKVLDKFGNMTEDGKRARTKEKIYISESGIYNLTISEDPIIKKFFEGALQLQPSFEGDLKSEVKEMKRLKRDFDFDEKFIDLPEEVLNLQNDNLKEFIGLSKNGEDIRILSIDPKGEISSEISNNFNIELDANQYDKTTVKLNKSSTLKNRTEVNITFEFILSSILGRRYSDWNSGLSILLINYDEVTTDNDKRNMTKTLNFTQPRLENLGSFDDVSIEFDIQPKSQNDSEKWIRWMIIDKIDYYITKEGYNKIANEVLNKFLLNIPNIPEFDEIKKEIREKYSFSEKYWYLQALEDLKVEEK